MSAEIIPEIIPRWSILFPFTSKTFNLNTALTTLIKEEIRRDKPLLIRKEPRNGPIMLGVEAIDKNNPYAWAGLLDSANITLDATEMKGNNIDQRGIISGIIS
ncbi:hypothetical protein DJ522_06180, partial [Sulfolobus sp. F3]